MDFLLVAVTAANNINATVYHISVDESLILMILDLVHCLTGTFIALSRVVGYA